MEILDKMGGSYGTRRKSFKKVLAARDGAGRIFSAHRCRVKKHAGEVDTRDI